VFNFKSFKHKDHKVPHKGHKGKNSIWMTFSTAPKEGGEVMKCRRLMLFVTEGERFGMK
jgi:hypothetical protein